MNGDRAPDPPKLGAVILQAGTAVIRLGADAARLVAEAASGRPQRPRDGESAFVSMLRHSATAAGSLAGLAFNAVKGRRAPAPPQAAGTRPAPGGPQLRPGGAARIPLSIDNPGTEPMVALVPRLTGATHCGTSAAPAFVLRFEPQTLTVGPRDFEKLVVTLELAEDIAAGEWSAFFTLTTDGSDPHELPFQVADGSAD